MEALDMKRNPASIFHPITNAKFHLFSKSADIFCSMETILLRFLRSIRYVGFCFLNDRRAFQMTFMVMDDIVGLHGFIPLFSIYIALYAFMFS